jgi:hypothetical protein
MKQKRPMKCLARPSLISCLLMAAVLTMPMSAFCRIPCSNGETAVYKTTIDRKGKLSGWATETSARYQPLQWIQKIQVTTEGIIWRRSEQHAGGGKEEMTALIREEPQLRVATWVDTLISPAGSQESRLEVDFTDPSLKYPANMIPAPVTTFLQRGADLKSTGVEHETLIWWGPKAFSRATWVVRGREKITVPAGTFECYAIRGKIIIEGEGLLTELLQKIMPGLTLYLAVEPPHFMVKLIMPVAGGDMQTDMLVRFTPGK